jgi:hypothetical protein
MDQHPVQAAVQTVLLGHGKIAVQQLVHRAAQKPMAMHGKLAARLAQPIDRQQLQNLLPRHAAAFITELIPPESIQTQLAPEMTTQPTVAEAAWTQQTHLTHLERQRVHFFSRNRTVIGKETGLSRLPGVFIEDFDALAPRLFLAVVDLPEIEQLTLGRLTASHAARLDDAPIAVKLSVLLARVTAEKHDRRQIANRPWAIQEGRSALHALEPTNPRWLRAIAENSANNFRNRVKVRRLG